MADYSEKALQYNTQTMLDTGESQESKEDIPDASSPGPSDSDDDLEAQPLMERNSPINPSTGAEYQVGTRKKLLYLFGYFLLNLTMTLYNKVLLGGLGFPLLLTAMHCSFVSVGCYALMSGGVFERTKLSTRDNFSLVAFSVLFTMNIAISNVSLALVSVPFHQILRSTSPVLTVIIYRLVYSRTYSTPTYLSIIPIILGAGLATYGDYYFTISGFLLTLLGTTLASIKSIASNRMMTGSLALSAYEILLRMSPLAVIQSVICSWATGELGRFCTFVSEGNLSRPLILALVGNGLIAFALNVFSFQTNKRAGALTMSIAANMKQNLTIVLSIVLFNVSVGVLNGFGMLVAVVGAGWYSKVELDSKGRRGG